MPVYTGPLIDARHALGVMAVHAMGAKTDAGSGALYSADGQVVGIAASNTVANASAS